MNLLIIACGIAQLVIVAYVWVLLKKYHRDQAMISRLETKVVSYNMTIEILKDLIVDAEHLDRVLKEEVEGRQLMDAQDVLYEQTKRA